MNLREQIVREIATAIDSSVHYNGQHAEQNLHNLTQIATDRAIAAFVSILPEPIDVEAKYELEPGRGPAVRIRSEEDEEHNNQQLVYLARYADDRGYNRYYLDLMDYIQGLYRVPQDVVHSEHDDSKSRPQRKDSNEPERKEPS